MYDILELSKMLLPELREIAKGLNIKKAEALKKQDLVYKILDQQALDATEKKSLPRQEDNGLIRPPEKMNQDRDPGQRRGKRPRTHKPIFSRPPESVISVSPDDLKRSGDQQDDQKENLQATEKKEEKPELFRISEPPSEESRVPFWLADNKNENKMEKPEETEIEKTEQPEEKIPEPVNGIEVLPESAPAISKDLPGEDPSPVIEAPA